MKNSLKSTMLGSMKISIVPTVLIDIVRIYVTSYAAFCVFLTFLIII